MRESISETMAGHNSAARAEERASIIRDIINVRRDVEGRIAELMQERKKNQGRIKSDLGMKVADFNALYRIAELEDEDRDQFLDTLREGFPALGIGKQGSLFPVLDPQPEEAPAKRGRLPSMDECRILGGFAYRRGDAQDVFPETITTPARREAFLAGWQQAKDHAARAAKADQDADFEEVEDSGEEAA